MISIDFKKAISENAPYNDWLINQYHDGAEIVCLCVGSFYLASIVEYIQRVKVEYARKHLEGGRKSINEIIYETGYNDVDAFRKIFRRITHLSPAEYRKKYAS